MTSLRSLGLSKDSPSEAALSTYFPDGGAHLSTIGVKALTNEKIGLKIFTSTQTFKNIRQRKAAVVNIVHDAELLVRKALPQIFPSKDKFQNFERSERVDAPRLSGADAFIEFKVKNLEKKTVSDEIGTSKVAFIIGSVKNIEIKNPFPRPFKRAEFFLIEAGILATRAIEAIKREKDDLAEELIQEVDSYRKKCARISPQSREVKLMEEIANSLKEKVF